MPSNNKHILVIRLSSMGDVAMTVPVLRAFTQQYPDIKVTIVTRYFFAPFFKELPNATVFAPDLGAKHKGVFGLYKLSKELKKLEFDCVADLHNVLRTKVITFFSGMKKECINKGRAEKKALISGKYFKQLKTTHQRYADVFEKLGFPLDLSAPVFPKPQILNKKCLDLLGNKKNVKLIGIAPFAFYSSKMYPLKKMEEVIAKLSKTNKVVLFGGGAKEANTLMQFEKKYKNVVSVAGKLMLEEELAIISNLKVMLSMDSANSHLAAMYGINVVTIWGVTHPFAGFKPFNQPFDNQLVANRTDYPEVPTSVYGNKYPEHYKEASGSILVDKIVDKVRGL